MTGPEKVAVFLALVGEEVASELVAQLPQSEVLQLRGLGKTGVVSHDDITEVFDELTEKAATAGLSLDSSSDYLRTVLSKAFGQDKAQELWHRILEDIPDGEGLEMLQEMDAVMLAPFLADEHPQTVAFLLAHLPPGQAADILGRLAEPQQPEIAYRISQLARTEAHVIDQVSKTLGQQVRNVRGRIIGGITELAGVLNTVEQQTEDAILTGLQAQDPELAEKVRAQMFTFEDLQTVDDRSLQTLAREIDRDQWTAALRTASAELKEKVFTNMSERAVDLLKDDMDAVGPMRLSEVEAAQKAILETATELEDAGTIQLRNRSNDGLV